jgi:hypothetical protein
MRELRECLLEAVETSFMSRGSTGVEEMIDFGLDELGGEGESKLEMQQDIWKDLEGGERIVEAERFTPTDQTTRGQICEYEWHRRKKRVLTKEMKLTVNEADSIKIVMSSCLLAPQKKRRQRRNVCRPDWLQCD